MSLIKSGVFNILVKILAVGIIFLFQATMSKYLTPSDYAEYGKFIVYGNYFALIYSFGFTASIIYTTSNINEFKVSYVYISATLFLVGVASLIAFTILNHIFNINEKTFFLIKNALIFGVSLSIHNISLSYFQKLGRFKTYAICNLFFSIYLLVAVVIVFITKASVNSALILNFYLTYYVIFSIVFFLYFGRTVFSEVITFIKRYAIILKSNISYGSKFVPLLLLSQIIYISDFIIIDFLRPDNEVAKYFVVIMISKLMFVVADTLGSIIFASYLNNRNSSKQTEEINMAVEKISNYLFYLSILGALAYYFIGDFVISTFFTSDYHDTKVPTSIMIIGCYGMVMYKLISRQFTAQNNWRPVYQSVVYSSIINLPLTYFAVLYFGIIGGVISSAISYWLCGFILVRQSHFYIRKLLIGV